MAGNTGILTAKNLPANAANLGRPIATLGDVLELAQRLRKSRVIVHPSAAGTLGLPPALIAAEPARRAREGSPHPFAAADGWRLSPPGLSHWIVCRHDRERIDVWFPGYDDAAGVGDAAPDDLLAGLALYEAHLGGTTYAWSPGSTATALIRNLHRGGTKLDASGDPPPPAEQPSTELDFRWIRNLDLEEQTQRFVHAFDLNAMYLAACSSLELGFGEPEHLIPKRPDDGLGFDPRTPGYWRVSLRRPDPLLPDPFDPIGRRAADRWLSTPAVELAAELGVINRIDEAWVYPRHHRYLEPFYAQLREARISLLTSTETPAGAVAMKLLKRTYTIGLGYLAGHFRTAGDPLYRPDWRHAVVAKARCNLYRRLRRLAPRAAPFAVLVDAVYYTSNSSDPVEAIPGLPIAHTLGAFKPAGSAPMGTVLDAIGNSPDPLRSLQEVLT